MAYEVYLGVDYSAGAGFGSVATIGSVRVRPES
jgi:hypothetical protein